MKLRCANCGEENPDRARYCMACTAPLAATPREEIRRTVTIVFADLVGSTAIGERLDPEALRAIQARYFDALRGALEAHGGVVEKYIGDAVMAVFGLGRAHEDDALRAVRAADEMRGRLAGLNESLVALEVELHVRIGVNTGDVVAGDPSLRQRLVTGDAVNVAARLEQAAGRDEVLLGQRTVALVRDAVRIEAVEPLELKGKSERVPAFRLIEAPVRASARSLRVDWPMIGRADELAALTALFEVVSAGRGPRAAIVVGGAGLGKTRLVQELVREVGGRGRVLQGRCLPYGDGITFWPVAEAIRAGLGVAGDESAEEVVGRIERALEGDPDPETLAPRVAAAIGVSAGSFPLAETIWALAGLVRALARAEPIVVALDDLQWAEDPMLDLVGRLGTAEDAGRLLVLGQARPELLERRERLAPASASWLQLAALDERETERLIDAVLGSTGLPVELRTRVSAAAAGTPLFVEQYLSMAVDEGVLVQRDGRWLLAGDAAELTVPPTVQALIADRLGRLSEEERIVLRAAAVIGQEFPRDGLRALVPDALAPLLSSTLHDLEEKRLVIALDAGRHRFDHLIVRDVTYGELLKRTRAELHQRFAAWIEVTAGERRLEMEEILGYHLQQAFANRVDLGLRDGRTIALGERAFERLRVSGLRALGRSDVGAASSLLGRAAGVLAEDDERRLELLSDLADALVEVGDPRGAWAMLAEGERRAGDRGFARVRLLLRTARMSIEVGDPGYPSTVEELDREARSIADGFEGEGDHLGVLRALHVSMTTAWIRGRFGECSSIAERAEPHLELADRGFLTDRLREPAPVLFFGPTPAVAALERCDDRFDRAGFAGQAGLLRTKAGLLAMTGRFPDAWAGLEEARALYSRLGNRSYEVQAIAEMGAYIAWMQDDPRRIVELITAIVDSEFVADLYVLTSIAYLGHAQLAVGDAQGARGSLARVEAGLDPEDYSTVGYAASLRAKLDARDGRVVEALAGAHGAVDLVAGTEDVFMLGDVSVHLADVCAALSRPDEERQALERAIVVFDAKGNVVMAARARERLAAVARRSGRTGSSGRYARRPSHSRARSPASVNEIETSAFIDRGRTPCTTYPDDSTGGVMDTGDTTWVLVSAALVMFMTAGLALFYGGLVRSKNVLATMMQSLAAIGLVSILWVLVGYTLAFGPDRWLLIGGLEYVGFSGVGAEPAAIAPTVPHSAFATFQMMFAVITPALIAGAFAERLRFRGYLLFVAIWSLVVYAPVAHWVWGGGFLGSAGVGAIDFAGGTVVHIAAGASALAAALAVGKRTGFPGGVFVPHNVPMVVLGAAILWFGWFGFNAGSALAAGGLASSSFLATHLAAAAAMVGWLVPEHVRHGKATTVGAATGAVAGLVAITPASGYVGPLPAIAIGLLAGAVCFVAVELKPRLGYDDSLDAVGVHLVGGIVGALLTGVFASLVVNPAGAAGSMAQVGRQAVAVGVTFVFAFGATLLILKVVDRTVGLRVDEDVEETGLDLVEHGELAYAFRERDRAPGRASLEMDDAELAALREQLVLEAAARVLDSMRAEAAGTTEPS